MMKQATNRGGRRGGMMVAARRALVAAGMAAMLAAPSVAAQTVKTTTACVGGAIGCNQVDFTFTLSSGSATVDFFRIAITGGGATFTPAQGGEAQDGYGVNFFTGAVSIDRTVLTGTFDPGFEAFLNPSLRVRPQFTAGSVKGAGSLSYTYQLGANGQTLYSGTILAVTATPEPSSLVLCAGGLLALGAGLMRRRRAV